MRHFRIYGDNIVECERAFGIICDSLAVTKIQVDHSLLSVVLPVVTIEKDGSKLSFQMIPGYGENRWNMDILSLLESEGGLLREAPDSLITEIVCESENIKFAIEFCGALPAGNQAWQRNGRALSFAYSKIPYFYITELGGFELTSERDRKAERVPNPLIPFSYIAISIEMGTAVLPIYIPSPGASRATQDKYKDVFGIEDLMLYIKKALLNEDTTEITKELTKKTIALVQLLAKSRSSDDSISPEMWRTLYESALTNKGKLGHTIEQSYTKKWAKKTSLGSLTKTFQRLLTEAKRLSVGVTSTNLPISMVKEVDRQRFSAVLKAIYPSGSNEFFSLIGRTNGPLALAWIAGFKPRGDDARPDRGLSPLLRMSVGSTCDVIAIVYGPAPESSVKLLSTNQEMLGKQNGLWESIVKTADAVIVDCKFQDVDSSTLVLTDRNNKGRLLRSHTYTRDLIVQKFGEQDVDTAIHHIFTKLFPTPIFEGLCNPPGGDWSGISLKVDKDGEEYRWLTLPRVTAVGEKRPDHIFQMFSDTESYIIICESKDKIRQIEPGIGPRLIKYVTSLVNSVPDIQRVSTANMWLHSHKKFDITHFEFVTVAAGILSNGTTLEQVGESGLVDLVIGFEFSHSRDVTIKTRSRTLKGKMIETHLKHLAVTTGLKIVN